MALKKIYLDWNLYSILKNPKSEVHLLLKEFLERNIGSIQLLYSPAHLDDLRQSSDAFGNQTSEDLTHLSKLTNNRLIVNYWGTSDIMVEDRDPTEFFDDHNEHMSQMQGLCSAVKLHTDQYAHLRDAVLKKYFPVGTKEICNFSQEQLNKLVQLMGLSTSLEEFLSFGLTLRTSPTDRLSFIDEYYTAYTTLDLINFYPDTMTHGEFENLKNDALHSAYGSLCDAFITNDNKCYHKSKFLFEYFKCRAKLIRTCKRKDIKHLEEDLHAILK